MFTAGLLAYQAGTILQQSDRYLDRLSRLLATATKSVGGERLLISLGAIGASEESPGPHGANPDGETDAAAATGEDYAQRGGMSKPARLDPVASLKQLLRSNLRLIGGWLVTGIGGIVGLIGSAVICLSFVFYLLQTRSEWIDRLLRVLYFLGLRPRRDSLERVQSTITVFGGFVVMVSICGAVVIGTAAWLIGLPQPYLWGLIFGLLEFVPYFGPMVGGTLLTLVALTTGEGSWWQAVTMLIVILAWLTLEGYVIAPMVYGRAVRFDPVMVLAAILFFGWLWGPLGMVTGMPVMVMLRELAIMSPETPALDALMEPQQSATTAHASHQRRDPWRPTHAVADRRLRSHRRLPDGGLGGAGRIDRLALPTPSRFGHMLHRPAGRPEHGRWLIAPVGGVPARSTVATVRESWCSKPSSRPRTARWR